MIPIEEAIRQTRFESARQRALINLVYSAGRCKLWSGAALKPLGLSWQQFNIMRILRGQAPAPASMKLLGERMLDPSSNASRLVDRLETKGLVTRITNGQDRRLVEVRLSPRGEEVLEEASAAITGVYRQLGGDMSEGELLQFSEYLDRFRGSELGE